MDPIKVKVCDCCIECASVEISDHGVTIGEGESSSGPASKMLGAESWDRLPLRVRRRWRLLAMLCPGLASHRLRSIIVSKCLTFEGRIAVSPEIAMDALDRASDIERALLTAPQDQANRHFVAAWLRWRRPGRLMPKRSAIELQDIKELLGRVILFELIGEDDVRIKVAGSQLRDHVNFEATGRNFAAITPPAQWPVRRWRLREMATRPCGGVMINRETETRSGDAVNFETVTLPLEPDGAGKPRLLISNVAVLGAVYGQPTSERPQVVYMPDEFRFLDLGAGIPVRIEP